MFKLRDIIHCILKYKNESGVHEVKLKELIFDRNIVIFGVPGAFTSTCSAKHLPSYVKNSSKILSLGIDDIICVSVNDPFVMHAWGEFNNENYNIKMMSDVGGHLARSMNIEADFGPNLLMRMKRFAMVLKQNEIKNFVIDEKGDYGKTSAENIISLLQK
jgi:peroxiredoxin